MVSKEKYYKLAEKQEQLITYLTNNDDERIEMLNQFYKITKEIDEFKYNEEEWWDYQIMIKWERC